jgi:hypothetical protein
MPGKPERKVTMTSKERSNEVYKFWLMTTLATDHKPAEWSPARAGKYTKSDSDIRRSIEWRKKQNEVTNGSN